VKRFINITAIGRKNRKASNDVHYWLCFIYQLFAVLDLSLIALSKVQTKALILNSFG
tara:strand:+ start:602 stop:772 length:171 start_codon:yes stop_codon:yes gene_type:complete